MNEKQPYTTPKLETHEAWHISTGISLPIGTNGVGDFLEVENVLEDK
jgi:hypothetical protein